LPYSAFKEVFSTEKGSNQPFFNFGCKGKGRAIICQFEMKECKYENRINFLIKALQKNICQVQKSGIK